MQIYDLVEKLFPGFAVYAARVLEGTTTEGELLTLFETLANVIRSSQDPEEVFWATRLLFELGRYSGIVEERVRLTSFGELIGLPMIVKPERGN